MKMLKITAACAALLLISQPAFAEAFVRPFLEVISPNRDGYSSKVGAGVAVGTNLGAEREQEVSLEFAGAQWNTSEVSTAGIAAVRQRFVTCLVNYRYHVGPASAPVRFYVGPAIGMTNNRTSLATVGPASIYAGDDSTWSFTWSGSAGLDIKLTERFHLDVGYRFLHVNATDTRIHNITYPGDVLEANIAYAGVSFRF